jgi:phage gpG-like protein
VIGVSELYGFKIAWALGRGPEHLARDLNRLARNVDHDRRGLLGRAIDEVITPGIEANFQEDGRPPWELLADSTLERREGGGEAILHLTGKGEAASLILQPVRPVIRR